jgi:hypothetical protein
MNQLINDEAVYRTAPATPGLLIIFQTIPAVTNYIIPAYDKLKETQS